jgi:type IV pilus assembly protein PilW
MNRHNKQRQYGFTLIEIMVALLIGLFLAAGVVQVFVSTKGTNRVQENLSRMQENARFAMSFLSSDIRQAGFSGGVCGDRGATRIAVNHIDSSAAIYQFKGDASNAALGGIEGGGLNPDTIIINRIPSLGTGIPLIAPFATDVSASLFVDASAGIAEGSIILVTDCNYQDIFQVTNNPAGTGELQHNTVGGGVVPANKTDGLSNVYGNSDSRIYVIAPNAGGVPAIEYSIATDGNGVPGLVQGTNQLVANIENMQILYGQRLGGGETYYVPADEVSDMEEVVSVRVSLLARSSDDFVATAPQTYFYNFDGTSTAAPDNRLRKVYTSTLTVRNRLN